jgi:hypothetical protein
MYNEKADKTAINNIFTFLQVVLEMASHVHGHATQLCEKETCKRSKIPDVSFIPFANR